MICKVLFERSIGPTSKTLWRNPGLPAGCARYPICRRQRHGRLTVMACARDEFADEQPDFRETNGAILVRRAAAPGYLLRESEARDRMAF